MTLRTHDGVQERNDEAVLEAADDLPSPDVPNLSRLSEAETQVYRACELDGLRPAELADATDRTPSTVRTILSRARRKMEADR